MRGGFIRGLFDIDRRDFLKFCSATAAMMGLSEAYAPKIAEAVTTAAPRTPVVWLTLSCDSGCTEMFIKAKRPSAAELILDVLSVEFNDTIMAAAGEQAEENLKNAVDKGGFILVIEGAMPTKPGYGTIAGKDMLDIVKEVAPKALAVVAIGSCATNTGIPGAAPNPSGLISVTDALKPLGIANVNLPGCPADPKLLVGVVLNYLLFKKLPDLDELGRPKMFYAKTIHEQCERRSHFEAGRFVEAFGTPEMEKGYCLYKMGCKGPQTHGPCPTIRYNDNASWCILAGAPCIGCLDMKWPDAQSPFYGRLAGVSIPGFGGVQSTADKVGKVLGAATAIGIGAHAAATAAKGGKKGGGE
ncbi:MAG: hydrogenase small subunit [Nitrospirae bacterium]|nr:hydrogenase small subunit [Nitrospirota bacterium]